MIDLSNKQGAIFDLDGLLIDSEPLWNESREQFFRKHGLDFNAVSPTEVMGAGVRDNIVLYQKRFGLQGDTDQLVDEYRQTFYDLALQEGRLTLLDGAEELLTFLSEHGFTLAIATGGHTAEIVERLLVRLQIRKPFSVIVSSDEMEKGKPDPQVYLLTLQKLKFGAHACVVFEDSVNGAKAGKGAGIVVIGVNQDEKLLQQLQEAGADIVLTSLREAIPLFRKTK